MSRVVIARVRSKRPSFITLRLDDLTPAVEQSDSGAVLLSVDRTNLFVPVAVAVTGLPANVTAVVETPTLTVTEAGTAIVFSAASNASVGTTRITITATPTGGQAVTIEADLSISAPSIPAGYTLVPDNDVLSQQQGDQFDITYTIVRVGGHTAPVVITAAGFPADVTVSYPDNQTFSGADTTKRVRGAISGGATPVASDVFTVTGVSTGLADFVKTGALTILTPNPAPGYTTVVSENWTAYPDTAALQAVLTANSFYASDSIDKQLCEIDPSALYNGRKMMKLVQPINSAKTPQLVKRFGYTIPNVWARTRIKFPTGWQLSGTPTNYAESQKLMGFGFANGLSRSIFAFSYNDLQLEGRIAGTQTPAIPYFGTVVRSRTGMADDSKVWVFVNHYAVFDTFHMMSRGWIYDEALGPGTARYVSLSIRDHRNAASPANSFLLSRNFNLTRSYAQHFYNADWEVVDNATSPDPFGLGDSLAAVPRVILGIDDANISVARGASVTRQVSITRVGGFNGVVETGIGTSRPYPLLPTGVTFSYAPSTLANGVNSTTLTVTVSPSAVPGTTTQYIYVACPRFQNGSSVHSANDYLALTLTVT